MYREGYEYDSLLESGVIGACLIEITAFARTKGLIQADMLYFDLHRDIYNVCSEMFDNSIPIDLLIITQEFHKRGLAKKYADCYYKMSQITNVVASTAHLETHCLYLRELYIKRLVIEIKNSANADYDVLDSVREIEEKLKYARELKATNDWQEFGQILIDLKLKLDSHVEDGIKTGIRELDNIRGGFKPSEMIVLGARPSVGKTALAGVLALKMAKDGKRVGIISLEMSNVQLATRIISIVSDIEFWKIDRSKLNSEYETDKLNKSIEENYNLPIFMSEKTGVTISDIRAKAMKLIYRKSLDILFIDYLGLIEPESNKNRNREQEVSAMSRGIKLLAMELNIPVVVLAQLNRETEQTKGQKPKLSNLRDSGSIEQDADVVVFLHSDYKAGILTNQSGDSTEFERDLIVAKYRNGETRDVKLGFEPKKMRLYDLDGYMPTEKEMEVVF